MGIVFDANKNEEPIVIRSARLLACCLMLEADHSVNSYFIPQMTLSAGAEYSIPIDVWARHVAGPPSFIGILSAETQDLFQRWPEVLEEVHAHARSINARYVPMTDSDLPGRDAVRTYLSTLRGSNSLAPAR
jgi:hypothetical protein